MKGFIKVYVEASPEIIEMVNQMRQQVKDRERSRGNKNPKLKTILIPPQVGEHLVRIEIRVKHKE